MPSKAVIVYKPVNECLVLVKSALNTLRSVGVEVEVVSVDDISCCPAEGSYYDLIIPIGGDGTFFRAVHTFVRNENQLVYPYPCGRRNFYYEKPDSPIEKSLEVVLKGNYTIELIPLYKLSYESSNFFFINDVVVVSANLGKTSKYTVDITSSHFKSRYALEGDGLIISTSHGSSGHNLSAGGPLVIPQLEVLIITHINPMNLGFPSIIVPGSAKIAVELRSIFNVYSDGVYLKTLERGSVIEVTHGQNYVRVARVKPYRDLVDIVIRQRGFPGVWK